MSDKKKANKNCENCKYWQKLKPDWGRCLHPQKQNILEQCMSLSRPETHTYKYNVCEFFLDIKKNP